MKKVMGMLKRVASRIRKASVLSHYDILINENNYDDMIDEIKTIVYSYKPTLKKKVPVDVEQEVEEAKEVVDKLDNSDSNELLKKMMEMVVLLINSTPTTGDKKVEDVEEAIDEFIKTASKYETVKEFDFDPEAELIDKETGKKVKVKDLNDEQLKFLEGKLTNEGLEKIKEEIDKEQEEIEEDLEKDTQEDQIEEELEDGEVIALFEKVKKPSSFIKKLCELMDKKEITDAIDSIDKDSVIENKLTVGELLYNLFGEMKTASEKTASRIASHFLFASDEQTDAIVKKVMDKMNKKREEKKEESTEEELIDESKEKTEDKNEINVENLVIASVVKDTIIENITKWASRGLQMNRKDKDLMTDTGGGSYKRKDPKIKPPRRDCKKPFRTKSKKPSEYDKDIDGDKDLKNN